MDTATLAPYPHLNRSASLRVANLSFQDPRATKLFQSIPKIELTILNRELASINKKSAEALAKRINKGENVALEIRDSRKTMTIAFKALSLDLITFEQFSSFHIIDAALRDSITNVSVFEYDFENSMHSTYNPMPNRYHQAKKLSSKKRLKYDSKIDGEKSIKTYFRLSKEEWGLFCSAMEKAALSEKKFYLINAPKHHCWSSLLTKIQEVSTVFDSPNKKIIIPSFSMFQNAIHVKAKMKNRKSLNLQPIYGLSDPKKYSEDKEKGIVHTCFYYPEHNPNQRYNNDNPLFRSLVDDHKKTGPFAAFLHDIYHTLRELEMTENHRKATWRLIKIAKKYEEEIWQQFTEVQEKRKITRDQLLNHLTEISNKASQQSIEIPEKERNLLIQLNELEHARIIIDELIDGELIFSYPPKKKPEEAFIRGNIGNQKFGGLFRSDPDFFGITELLTPKIKKYFIQDMVENKKFWREEYNLGMEDLYEEELFLYEKIAEELLDSSKKSLQSKLIAPWSLTKMAILFKKTLSSSTNQIKAFCLKCFKKNKV